MGLQKDDFGDKKFISISLGKLRQEVEEGTNGAVERKIVNKTTGKERTAYELVFKSIDGHVTDISFKDTKFGKMFNMTIDGITLSVNTESRYFTDIAKKLPNVILSKPIYLAPYDFTDKEGKRRVGVSIGQGSDKVMNYFYDGKKNLYNFPEPEEGEKDGDDWKIYFTKVKKFLVEFIENMEKKYIEQPATVEDVKSAFAGSDDEVKIDDLPF